MNTGREDEYNTFHAMGSGQYSLFSHNSYGTHHRYWTAEVCLEALQWCWWLPLPFSTVNISFLMNSTNYLLWTVRTARFASGPTPSLGSSLTIHRSAFTRDRPSRQTLRRAWNKVLPFLVLLWCTLRLQRLTLTDFALSLKQSLFCPRAPLVHPAWLQSFFFAPCWAQTTLL